MMLAEVSQMEIWMLVSNLLVAIGTVGALFFMVNSANKKQSVDFPQPVTITITEELHKVFAAKEEFQKHVAENREAHEKFDQELKADRANGQTHISQRQKTLFDQLERTAASLDNKLEAKHLENTNRLNRMEKSIGGLETATTMQNQQLSGITATVNRILERLPR